MTEQTHSAATERVLEAAERLFSERGYKSVTLRDIAADLHMRAASLYNHAPGGKEQLFVWVTERGLHRHAAGIGAVLATTEPRIEAQLRAIAGWLLANPPINLDRMYHADMPAIAPAEAERLSMLAYLSLIQPIREAIHAAAARGEIEPGRANTLAATFVTSIEAMRELERRVRMPQREALDGVIALLLEGARPRTSQDTKKEIRL